MPYRDIPNEDKAEAVKELLTTDKEIEQIAKEYNISKITLKRERQKVIEQIPEIVKKKKPGPKTKDDSKKETTNNAKANSKSENNDENKQNDSKKKQYIVLVVIVTMS